MRRRSHGSYMAPAALFLAFILLFLTCVSVPFAQGIRLFTLIDRHTGGSIRFGLWGYCLPKRVHGYPPCTMLEVGWTFNNIPTLTGLENSISPQLTGSLFIHPVVTAVVFIIFVLATILVSKPSFQRKLNARLSGRSSLHVVATTFTLSAGALASVAFIMDVVVIARVKAKVNRASGTAKNMKAHTGIIAWLSFIATIILWATSVLLFLLRKNKRSDSRRSRRSMDDNGSAYDSDASLRRTESDVRTVRSSYSRQVTDHSVHSRSASAYVSRGEGESEMVEDRNRGSRRSVYTDEAEDNSSEKKDGFLASLFPCLRRKKERDEDEYKEDVELRTLGSSRSVTAVEDSEYIPDKKSRSVIATGYDSRSDVGNDLSEDGASRYSEPVDAAYISKDRTRSGRSRSRSLSYTGSEYSGERLDDTVGESTDAYRTERDDVNRTRSRTAYSREAESFEPSNAEREISADTSREVLEDEYESQPSTSPTVTPSTSGPYETEREHSIEGIESRPVSNDGVSRDVRGDEYRSSYANTDEDDASQLSPSQQTPSYVPSGREGDDLEEEVLSTDRSRDMLDSSELEDRELRESTQLNSHSETEQERAGSEEDLFSASRTASSVARSEGEVVSHRASQSGASNESLSVEQGSDVSTMELDDDAELSREVSVISATPSDERGDEEYDSAERLTQSSEVTPVSDLAISSIGEATPDGDPSVDDYSRATRTLTETDSPEELPVSEVTQYPTREATERDAGSEFGSSQELHTRTEVQSKQSPIGDREGSLVAENYDESGAPTSYSNQEAEFKPGSETPSAEAEDDARSMSSRRTPSYVPSDEEMLSTPGGDEGTELLEGSTPTPISSPGSIDADSRATASRAASQNLSDGFTTPISPRDSDVDRDFSAGSPLPSHEIDRDGSHVPESTSPGVARSLTGQFSEEPATGSYYSVSRSGEIATTRGYTPSHGERTPMEGEVSNSTTPRSPSVLYSGSKNGDEYETDARTSRASIQPSYDEEDLLSANRTATSVPRSESDIGSEHASHSETSNEALSVAQGSDASAIDPDSDAELSREASVIPATLSDERGVEKYDSAERLTRDSEVTPVSHAMTSPIDEASPDSSPSAGDYSRGTRTLTETDAPEELPASETTPYATREATERDAGSEDAHESRPPMSPTATPTTSGPYDIEREHSSEELESRTVSIDGVSQDKQGDEDGSSYADTEKDDASQLSPGQRTPSYVPSDSENGDVDPEVLSTDRSHDMLDTPELGNEELRESTQVNSHTETESDRAGSEEDLPSASRTPISVLPSNSNAGSDRASQSGAPSEALSVEQGSDVSAIETDSDADLSREVSVIPPTPSDERGNEKYNSAGHVTRDSEVVPVSDSTTSYTGEGTPDEGPSIDDYSRGTRTLLTDTDALEELPVSEVTERDAGSAFGSPPKSRSLTELRSEYSPVSEQEQSIVPENYDESGRLTSHSYQESEFKSGSGTPYAEVEDDARTISARWTPSYVPSDEEMLSSPASNKGTELLEGSAPTPTSSPGPIDTSSHATATQTASQNLSDRFTGDNTSPPGSVPHSYRATSAGRYTTPISPRDWDEGRDYSAGSLKSETEGYTSRLPSDPRMTRMTIQPSYETDRGGSYVSESTPASMIRSPTGKFSEEPMAGTFYSEPRSGDNAATREYTSFSPSPGARTSLEGEVPNSMTLRSPSYIYSGSKNGDRNESDPRTSRMSIQPSYETDQGGSYVSDSLPRGTPSMARSPTQRSLTGQYSEEPMTGSYNSEPRSANGTLTDGYGSLTSRSGARTTLEGEAQNFVTPRSPSYPISTSKYGDDYEADPKTSRMSVRPYETNDSGSYLPASPRRGSSVTARSPTRSSEEPTTGVYYPDPRSGNTAMSGGYSRYTPSPGAQTSFEGEIPNYGTMRASSYPASGSKYGDEYESGPRTSRISTPPYATDYRNSYIPDSPPLSTARSPIRRSPIRQYSESPVAGSYYSEGPAAGSYYSEGPAADSYYSRPRSGNMTRGYGSLTPSPGARTAFEGEVPNDTTQSRLSYEPYSGSNYGNDYTDPRNSRMSLGPPYETDYRGSYVPVSPSIGDPRARSFTRYSEEPMAGGYYPDSRSGDNALTRGYSRYSPTPARTSLEGDAPIYSQPRSPSYTYSGNKYDDGYTTDSTLPVEPVHRTDATSAFVPDRQSSYSYSPGRQYTADGNYSDSYYPEANDRNSSMPGGVPSERRTAFEPAGDEFASGDSGLGTTPASAWRDSPELSQASYDPPLENPDAAYERTPTHHESINSGAGILSSPSSSIGTIRGSSLGDTIYPEDSFLRGSSVEGITEPRPEQNDNSQVEPGYGEEKSDHACSGCEDDDVPELEKTKESVVEDGDIPEGEDIPRMCDVCGAYIYA